MIGADTPFEMEWKSIYTFQCRSIEEYRHGRVLFIGDAAHQVSPSVRGAATVACKTRTISAGNWRWW